jgi:asparagine synthase (glutamine-hydrolysing)
MSGICGIFQRNGAPVTPARLERMMTAMASWGADGQGTWCDGPVALGHSLVHTTPESRYESLPLQSPAPAVVLTVTSRLDNRDELADALGIAPPDRATLPDSTLILKAYGAWGEACPARLLGDWAFALWDTRQRRLFLARDQHGNTGLFYYCTPHCFAFASCLAGLLALPEVPRQPHAFSIAQLLVSWPGDGRATPYADLWHVPPAHAMVVTPDRMTMRQYWAVEATPALRLASDAEYIEAFLDLYTAAVRCRLRSIRPVGILLSGDSIPARWPRWPPGRCGTRADHGCKPGVRYLPIPRPGSLTPSAVAMSRHGLPRPVSMWDILRRTCTGPMRSRLYAVSNVS